MAVREEGSHCGARGQVWVAWASGADLRCDLRAEQGQSLGVRCGEDQAEAWLGREGFEMQS